MDKLLAALLVGVEDVLVAVAGGVDNDQLVGRGVLEAYVEHLMGREAIHGVAKEFNPRLQLYVLTVGKGGLEFAAEVGEVPPLAQEVGTHSKGVITAGGIELQGGDGVLGVELLRCLVHQLFCLSAGSALYDD